MSGRRLTGREFGVIAVLSAVSLGGYLWTSGQVHKVGFPLDDAWIHQTYARNLAVYGEWAFRPGVASAGSTAPLWSALLAVGHGLGVGPYVWTFLLGWAALVGMGVVGWWGMRVLAPEREAWAMRGAALLIFEWHLVWAAGSGMETLPFALVVTTVLVWCAASGSGASVRMWFGMGLLIGAGVWLRPDAITLLGPVFVVIVVGEKIPGKLPASVVLTAGFLLLFLPYLGFNYLLDGQIWPNTFFAKQAEYAVLREQALGARLLAQLALPLVGVGAALLPGVIIGLVRVVRERRWAVAAGLVWFLGYAGLYAWRLPVTYQHGRYLIPAMPIFMLWGLVGMAQWVRRDSRVVMRRLASGVWVMTAGLLAGAFWVMGARAYALDVAVIETEMVAAAQWVAQNTEPGALVAAHDIGALGYFGERELLDLAGLISPDVTPFIRDEEALGDFMAARGARYFVTLRGWYPLLESRGTPVYDSSGSFSPNMGGTNMVVYRLDGD